MKGTYNQYTIRLCFKAYNKTYTIIRIISFEAIRIDNERLTVFYYMPMASAPWRRRLKNCSRTPISDPGNVLEQITRYKVQFMPRTMVIIQLITLSWINMQCL